MTATRLIHVKISTELDLVGFPGAKGRTAGGMGGFEDTAVTVFPLVPRAILVNHIHYPV